MMPSHDDMATTMVYWKVGPQAKEACIQIPYKYFRKIYGSTPYWGELSQKWYERKVWILLNYTFDIQNRNSLSAYVVRLQLRPTRKLLGQRRGKRSDVLKNNEFKFILVYIWIKITLKLV